MVLNPLWLTLNKEYDNPTEYSRDALAEYEKTAQHQEAFSDIIAARKGINPDDMLSFYAWRAFEIWFMGAQNEERTVGQIERFIKQSYALDQYGRNFVFHRTTLNHVLNRYMAIGLIYKIKKTTHDGYHFELQIKRMGIDWFRIGNQFMLGRFQWE